MKKRKNNLDERQERALLQIESRGFWLAWGGLLLAILVQLMLRRMDLWSLLPEWVIFMGMNLYMVAQCLRHNIWDRHLEPGPRANAVISAVLGAVLLPVILVTFSRNAGRVDGTILLLAVFFAALPAALCFAVLQLIAQTYRRKREQAENAPDEE
ncbi:DUF6773 family protein [Allofournierella sp.]|uniref:DUF6773 family protein n=1 Tax=Allofournierella sp. TaxID=1940256 RepID=UPI003AB51AB7